jgi:hypothetical protein
MAYELYVTMDTDDDATIEYLGKQYCFYGDDLRILKQFDTKEEAIDHLKQVKVLPGGKASNYIQDHIDQILDGDVDRISICGNQEIEIEISEVDYNIDIHVPTALELLRTIRESGSCPQYNKQIDKLLDTK